MKKRILLSMALLTTGVALTTGALANTEDKELSAEKLKEIRSSSKSLQNPMLTIKKGKDLKRVYFLQLEANGPRGSRRLEGFVDKTTGALYLGGGYDKDGNKFTFPANLKVVKDAVAFTYGSGSKDLYVVTDPECPFCKKFHSQTEGKLADYKVHVIFMPLAFHKNAKAMTNYILAGKDNAEKYNRYKETMTGTSKYKDLKIEGDTLKNYLKKSRVAASELGARGTPSTFIGDSLKPIAWPELVAPQPKKAVK
jgi:thiol:disulfide interchange protein DsbC